MAVIEKLDSITFDQLLGEQKPFIGEHPECDLRSVKWITPAALVQLAAGGHALAHSGRRLRIRLEDESVRGYLARCGFGVLSDVATIDPPLDGSPFLEVLRGSNPMLIELTQIKNGAALPALLDQIVWVLRNRLKYKKHDAFDVATAVSEACQNTFDHNAQTTGFLAMQVYGGIKTKRFLEIGISDFGDGLLATLRRNPKNIHVLTDLAAIQSATQLGTSEHDDPTRGTGMYHLLEITYKHQGAIQIKSGAAKVRYRMDKRRGWAFQVPSTAGVHLALMLPSKAA